VHDVHRAHYLNLSAAIQDVTGQTLTDLQRMADNNETAPLNYFQLWKLQMLKNAGLSAQITILKEEIEAYREQIAGMVPKSKARDVAISTHRSGQLKGQNSVIDRLEFPWAPERTKLYSELATAYLKHFTYRAKGGAKKPPGTKTLEGYRADIGFFVEVMGDVHIGAIDRDFAGEYFNILRKLPANISRKAEYRDKTIPELLALKAPPQSEYNASKKMERPSGMFKWALREKRGWGIDSNPFEGFGQSGDNATVRRPFTTDELKALLTHPNFVNRTFEKSYAYWLMPLAIFTGARLGELCQLDIKDFVEIEGLTCIDINDTIAFEDIEFEGRKKRVKTRNARRLVPIHPELIRLGLLRYVETLREKKQVHFFPELSRTRRDGPAHAPSNWFQRFRARVGITEKQEGVFHSFRHGFITTLLDAGITPHLIAPVVGHEGKLITDGVYCISLYTSRPRSFMS
jgi:integrase